MSTDLIVFITTGNLEEARRIGSAVVEKRLAACVNIFPEIESIYWWEGKVTQDRESFLIAKTTVDRFAELEQTVKALHSYTTPEIIAFPIERGSGEYLRWLRESVGS